jgi:hypothetical protein
MPAKRSAMRKIREVLRLKFEAKLSHERIAAATGVSKGAVSNFVQRAIQKSLGWPLPDDLDDAALERALFPQVVQREQYTPPDYAYGHQELKRKGVTLQRSGLSAKRDFHCRGVSSETRAAGCWPKRCRTSTR